MSVHTERNVPLVEVECTKLAASHRERAAGCIDVPPTRHPRTVDRPHPPQQPCQANAVEDDQGALSFESPPAMVETVSKVDGWRRKNEMLHAPTTQEDEERLFQVSRAVLTMHECHVHVCVSPALVMHTVAMRTIATPPPHRRHTVATPSPPC